MAREQRCDENDEISASIIVLLGVHVGLMQGAECFVPPPHQIWVPGRHFRQFWLPALNVADCGTK